MNSFSNLFQSNFVQYPETPQEFNQYKLQFLHQHEPSFKQLGDVFETKDEDKNSLIQSKGQLLTQHDQEEDFFELQVEIKLRKYTSFQNGFMENHREILKNSLQNFLEKASKIIQNSDSNSLQFQITNDIKSIVFNEKLFSAEEISENRERFLKKVDEFKILREMFHNSLRMQKTILKDAMLMGLWILKNTDQIVSDILHENNFCIKQVQQIKNDLLDYLQKNENITFLKSKIAQEAQGQTQFDLMIQSWLYTLLIAKLGYFENDCFDLAISLEEHLKALLKEEIRQHSLSDSDSDDDELFSLQFPIKKRKL